MLEIDESYKDYVVEAMFENPEGCISTALDSIKEQRDKLTFIPNDSYSYVPLGRGTEEMEIAGVYENGIVYRLVCIPNAGAGKYDTATSALLIVKTEGDSKSVKYILDKVDQWANPLDGKNDKRFRPVNEEKVAESVKELGERIDGPLFDKDEGNIFTRKRKMKEKELASNIAKSRVSSSIEVIQEALRLENEKGSIK